jgi:hypothetical protein
MTEDMLLQLYRCEYGQSRKQSEMQINVNVLIIPLYEAVRVYELTGKHVNLWQASSGLPMVQGPNLNSYFR